MATTLQHLSSLIDSGIALAEAAQRLGLEYDADDDCVYLPGWLADDGNAEVAYPHATSGEDAAQQYVEDGDWGDDYRFRTLAHRVRSMRRVYELDDDGDVITRDVAHESHVIIIHPDEPVCSGSCDGEHRWVPAADVGIACGACNLTIAETSMNVCALCGTTRTTRAATQGCETEYDHDCVTYALGVEADRLLDYYADREEYRPAGIDPDGRLARELRELEVGRAVAAVGYECDSYRPDAWTVVVGCGRDDVQHVCGLLRERLDGYVVECVDDSGTISIDAM